MIRHATEGMNPVAKTTAPLLKQKEETTAVSVGQKNDLPAVAPEDNMINSTRKMDTRFTSHNKRP
jgi:hypothetical protein